MENRYERNSSGHEITGEELYRRFAAGDESAFEILVGLYRKDLTQYIQGFVNDIFEAEDIMIDAFAVLAEELRFAGRSSLKTYLYAIAQNLALRRLKNRKNRDNISIDELLNLPGDPGASPETDYLNGERGERLRSGIQKLKPEYGAVLRLLYFENMSYTDAGIAMNKNLKQITNLAYRAKQSLKAALEREGFADEKR